MGDDAQNYDELPVTFATRTTIGDIYPAGSDAPQARLVDTSGQQSLFGTGSNASATAVAPLTGTALLAGTDVSVGEGIADYLAMGLYNASFFMSPPRPDLPIGEDNAMPYWRTGGASTSPMEWRQEALVPSGTEVIRLTGTAVANGDDVYIEQIVPVRGFAGTDALWARVTANGNANVANSASVLVYVRVSFFTAAGVAVGDDREDTIDTLTLLTAGDYDILAAYNSTTSARYIPSTASFARVRFGLRSTVAIASAVNIIFNSARVFRSTDLMLFNAPSSLTGAIAGVRWNGTRKAIEAVKPEEPRDISYTFSPSVVAIPFSFLNLAAGATNELQLWDVAVAQPTPYMDMAWRGSVIGISYRISGARSGGTFNVRARSATGTVYLETGALGTGAALTGSVRDTISNATNSFAAGVAIGCSVVTTAAHAPTTLEISVLVYVALEVTG